jgi:pre-mRNA-splicing helicase BRR2
LHNRVRVLYCSRLRQAQGDAERAEIEDEMRATGGVAADLLTELGAKADAASWTRDRIGEFADKARREARALTTSITDTNIRDAGIKIGPAVMIIDDNADEDDAVGYTMKKDESRATAGRVSTAEQTLDLDALQFSQGAHLMANSRCELPEKSWRATKKGYEEVHVPAVKPIIPPGERLVDISDLPAWMRPAFPGIRQLNRIQSRLMRTALYEIENILLCAPTGAGKTNVALLTMLNVIAQYRLEGAADDDSAALDLDGFKIVYIAPMKALVQECVQSFGKRLAPFGITVREVNIIHYSFFRQIIFLFYL